MDFSQDWKNGLFSKLSQLSVLCLFPPPHITQAPESALRRFTDFSSLTFFCLNNVSLRNHLSHNSLPQGFLSCSLFCSSSDDECCSDQRPDQRIFLSLPAQHRNSEVPIEVVPCAKFNVQDWNSVLGLSLNTSFLGTKAQVQKVQIESLQRDQLPECFSQTVLRLKLQCPITCSTLMLS